MTDRVYRKPREAGQVRLSTRSTVVIGRILSADADSITLQTKGGTATRRTADVTRVVPV